VRVGPSSPVSKLKTTIGHSDFITQTFDANKHMHQTGNR
jgi:hypothetical protein